MKKIRLVATVEFPRVQSSSTAVRKFKEGLQDCEEISKENLEKKIRNQHGRLETFYFRNA